MCEYWCCGLVIVIGWGDVIDKVVGFEIGVDDYVMKFFDLCELLVCIKVVLCCLVLVEVLFVLVLVLVVVLV